MAEVTLSGITILLAETQKPMRQAIKSSIRAMKNGGGAHILEADDGAIALNSLLMHGQKIDVALIDWEMVPMDGSVFLNVLRNEREYVAHQKTPVIVTTSRASPQMITTALRLGAHAVMQKPIVPTELLSRMLSILNENSAFVMVEDALGKGKPFVGPLTKWSAEEFARPAQAENRRVIKL